jgi:adenosylcobinamide kinase/adenosylcobinamide-phosphate guanylyltransferase
MPIILISGGARSGKSMRAEARAQGFAGKPVYIATAEAFDHEMRERIAKHRARRGNEWIEHETPLELVAALNATDGGGARLIDCLTLWLSNLMHEGRDWAKEAAGLAEALEAQRSPVVLVTNEVGSGIVPDNALAREFRDAAGLLNQ